MSGTLIHNKDAAQLVQGIPTSGLVGWKKLNPLLKAVAARLPFKLSVDGLDLSEIEGGFHLGLKGRTLVAFVRIRTDTHNILVSAENSPYSFSFGSPGSYFTFAAYVTSAVGEVTYAWTHNGAPYQAHNGAVVGVNGSVGGDAGLYACTIRDGAGSEVVLQLSLSFGGGG